MERRGEDEGPPPPTAPDVNIPEGIAEKSATPDSARSSGGGTGADVPADIVAETQDPDEEPQPELQPAQSTVPASALVLERHLSAEEMCRAGTAISLAGILHCLERFGISKEDGTSATTSDFCHAHIKPATVAAGWRCIPQLVEIDEEGNDISARSWYRHEYVHEATGEATSEAPPGTRSMCDLLAADPTTEHMVGKPTHFLSHAWLYGILNVVAALGEFEATQHEGAPPIFWWFDVFSIDEHSAVVRPQRWWSETFKAAIQLMGHTVMILSPWDAPIPLTRAWCLWELYCTVSTGSKFEVCFGPAERAAFEQALFDPEHGGFGRVMASLSMIDVSKAEAGNPADLSMIVGAARQVVGGLAGLNNEAVSQIRRWCLSEVRRLGKLRLEARGGGVGAQDAMEAAHVLKDLGELDEATELYELARAEFTAARDATSVDLASGHIAIVLRRQKKIDAAQPLFEESIAFRTRRYGEGDPQTLRARHGLGNCLMDRKDYTAARVELEAAAAGLKATLGPAHEWTLAACSGAALLLSQMGDLHAAVAAYEDITATHIVERGKGHWRTLHTRAKMAQVMVKLGRVHEAVPILEEAVPALRAQLGQSSHVAFVDEALEEARRALEEL